MYVVLHEIAHAINDDLGQNEISDKENQAQELRADSLAFEWFNHRIEQRNIPALRPLTQDEVTRAQQKTGAMMSAALSD